MYYLTKHNLFVQEVVAKVNIWNGGGLMGRCWMASMAPGTRYTCCFSFCGHQGDFLMVERIVNDARLVA